MGVISTTQSFSNGDQVTATKLNNITGNSTFDSSAVDDSTTQISGGAIVVKDGGVTSAKLALSDGTAAAPGIKWNSDTDTGFYHSAPGATGYSANGTGQIVFQDGAILPVTTNNVNLGASNKKFKNLYVDGTGYIENLTVEDEANIDTLVVDNIEPLTDNDTDLGASDKKFRDLYVNGAVAGSGSASDPSYGFVADTDSGLYSAGVNELGVSLGGTGQVKFTDGSIEPITDNDVDLGASNKKFKNLYVDGTGYIEELTVEDEANIDTLVVNNIEPLTDNDTDLGASDKKFRDLYVNGTAYIDTMDSLVVGSGGTALSQIKTFSYTMPASPSISLGSGQRSLQLGLPVSGISSTDFVICKMDESEDLKLHVEGRVRANDEIDLVFINEGGISVNIESTTVKILAISL